MPILEFMAIKGLFTLFTGAAAKVALMATVKTALAYGVGAAITGLLIAGIVVSGITWTEKCVNSLGNAIKALENGEATDAIVHFANLAISAGIGADALPDAVHDYLVQSNVSESNAKVIAEAAQELQSAIADKIVEIKTNRGSR